MKVKELIRRLKKHNPDAEVVWQDHDQGDDEVSNIVVGVDASDSEVLQDRFEGPVVCLR